jgi:hypothetical protein
LKEEEKKISNRTMFDFEIQETPCFRNLDRGKN